MGDSSSTTTNPLYSLLEKFQKGGRPSFIPCISFSTHEWQMCSKEEGYDRQQFMELSELECTNDTCHAKNIKQRKVDPYKCISKYKRSAAGGGSSHERYAHVRPRSVVDLHVTTCYLLHTLVSKQSPRTSDKDHNDNASSTTYPFSTICNFVDDRIRAIQVEYVTHYMSSLLEKQPIFSRALERARHDKSLSLIIDVQMKCIRYHLLSQYLLRDASASSSLSAAADGDNKSTTLSKSFELKFNFSALRSAMTHGIDLLVCQCRRLKRQVLEQQQPQNMDQYLYYITCLDELLSYQSLLHFVGSVMTNKNNQNSLSHIQGLSTIMPWLFLECGTGLSAIESIYKDVILKVTTNTSNHLNLFPRWKWTLELANTFENGNYIGFFKHLRHSIQVGSHTADVDEMTTKNTPSCPTASTTTATTAAAAPTTTTITTSSPPPQPPPLPPTTTSLMAALQKAKSSQLPPKVATTSCTLTSTTISFDATIPIVTPPPSRTTSTAGGTAIESNILTTNDDCQSGFPQEATCVETKQRDTQSVPAVIENSDHDWSNNNATDLDKQQFKMLEKERWKILCRSCVLPVLPLVRLLMLEHYNKTWMKHEKVSVKDLSKLLYLQHDKTIQLCQMVGLPVTTKEGNECTSSSDEQQIQFKAVPMNVDTLNVKQLDCLGRDDLFVFCGSRNTSSLSSSNKDGMSPGLDLDPSQWKQDQDHVILPPKEVIDFLLV